MRNFKVSMWLQCSKLWEGRCQTSLVREAEAAHGWKGGFYAMMSHDLTGTIFLGAVQGMEYSR